MGLKVIATDKAPAAIGPYSQGIGAGPWLYVSGQIGLEPKSGNLVSDDFAAQARQALANLRSIIETSGHALIDVVSVDVFLTDISRFASFNQIYEEFFAGHKPARAVVEVSSLPKGALVEIKCIAFRQE
jgi:2-iminobutanoate/2-iminopropanoate deaminase